MRGRGRGRGEYRSPSNVRFRSRSQPRVDYRGGRSPSRGREDEYRRSPSRGRDYRQSRSPTRRSPSRGREQYSQDEWEQRLKERSKIICWDWKKNNCTAYRCQYLHPETREEDRREGNSGGECWQWRDTGECSFGRRCKYNHPVEDRRRTGERDRIGEAGGSRGGIMRGGERYRGREAEAEGQGPRIQSQSSRGTPMEIDENEDQSRRGVGR